MAVYAGMLEYMDQSIGRMLDHLRQRDMPDNTAVVFVSDNGGEAAQLMAIYSDYYAKNFDLSYEHLGEKGSYSEYGPGWASASMAPFTNFKGLAAEGGIRAPLIIRYPAAVSAGVRTDAFAYVTNVVPTLLVFAGVDASEKAAAVLAGRSMVPLLTARADHVHAPDEAIGYEAAGGTAVYRGEWKLVRSVPPYGDRKWRLCNLRDDPNEASDMSSAEPELARAMLSDFGAYAARNGIIEVPADYDVIRQARANAAAAKWSPHPRARAFMRFHPVVFHCQSCSDGMDQSQLPGNRL